ncbi:UDP-glucuronate 4-epimerase [Reichenbachiella faecimaris]|uniref:UDP-glucuronate 4-epimerase n=1 Tax=Reichenbachiella faecimaris TaxID=692418 RepID=A0A1W2GCH5_REIFA|nr:SDR family NAD(P)-dependent oxidoreductase [Reichenbachiella faecimaris]SMD34323.1 UDP-glucuronate 4-epimerase [Reichenbachiella faecimaris]
MKKILITGAAGFIGFHLSRKFSSLGFNVVGIDSLNDYYDTQLKNDRLEQLSSINNFTFLQISITDKEKIDQLFKCENFEYVINLAAQAGVRYSIDHPYKYIDANLVGFINILEACRAFPVKHLIFASSSSVYGANRKIPFAESDHADHPVSLYAATKKANEMMAHSYSSLYNISCTGLRFFTVYGPWGRPDMAYFKFAQSIIEGKVIKVFNNGDMGRDFTFIDDIVESISRLLDCLPKKVENLNSSPHISQVAPFAVYNIGNNTPVRLLDFIEILEKHLGIKAVKEFLPMQPGDVKETFADIERLSSVVNFYPNTTLNDGLDSFVKWFKEYYQIKQLRPD